MTADKVADASAIAAVLFDEPRREDVERRLSGAVLHAPLLLDIEIASVCLKKLRTEAYPRGVVLKMYAAYGALAIDRTEVPLPEVVWLAEGAGLSLYDACYLWLARQLRAELVTLDEKLQRASAIR